MKSFHCYIKIIKNCIFLCIIFIQYQFSHFTEKCKSSILMKCQQLMRENTRKVRKSGKKGCFSMIFNIRQGKLKSFVGLVCNFIIYCYYYLFTPCKILSAVPTQFPNFVKQFCCSTYKHKSFRQSPTDFHCLIIIYRTKQHCYLCGS